jgi:hypothetical protein
VELGLLAAAAGTLVKIGSLVRLRQVVHRVPRTLGPATTAVAGSGPAGAPA